MLNITLKKHDEAKRPLIASRKTRFLVNTLRD